MSSVVKRKNLFLTGMMGTGKSSLGRIVAEMLDYGFVDTDKAIEQAQSQPVGDIFRQQGEEFFRKQETELLRALVRGERQVIATGGGMLVTAGNLELAAANGLVILLEAPMPVLAKRIVSDGSRPLIAEKDPSDSLERIYNQRRDRYEQIECRIEVAMVRQEEITTRIVNTYREWLRS